MARTVRRVDPDQQRRHRKHLILGVVVGVVVLILLGILSFYLRLTGGPALPREVRRRMQETARQAPSAPRSTPAPGAPEASGTAPAAPQPATRASLPAGVPAGTPSFPQQVQQVQAAAQSGDTSQHTMYITDSELSEQLGAEARKHEEVEDIHGYFEKGQAFLAVRVNAKGHVLNLTLILQPRVADGTVSFGVDQVFVGQVAAPPAIAQKVQEEITKRSAWFTPERTGMYVDSIEIKSGLAVLKGRPVRK